MEQGFGGGITKEQIVYNGPSEGYPEERKPALYLSFKKILFEKRNKLLTESDKYMLLDYPNNLKNKENILIYRQELRDYPALSFFENFDGNFGEGEKLLPTLVLIE